MILSVCDAPEVMRVMRIVNIIINIIRIAVPIILIVSVMLDLARAVSNSELNKITKSMVAKVIAAVLVFLIPTFIRLIADISSNNHEYENCLRSISKEDIEKAFESQEDKLVEKAEESINVTDYNNALSYLNNIKNKVKKEEYQKRLKVVSDKIEEERKKNQFTGGGVTLTGTVTAEEGQYTFDGPGTDNIKVNVLNGEYIVAKTQADLSSYVSYIASHRLYQASDTTKYGDKCLGFSYMHAWGYYTNRRNYTADNGGNYTSGGSFSKFIDEDLSKVMNVIYNEILNGRPVVIQVNGNKQGTSRHFATVVGFKSSVKNAGAMKGEDLLIIDSWDGKLERMDQPTSRFLTTGKACGKKYQGYYILYIKHAASPSTPSSGTQSGSKPSSGSISDGVGHGNESIHTSGGSYGCTKDAADTAWYNCFSRSHNLVVPSLGAQGSTITMKVGESRSFAVKLASECGSLVKWTRTSADGASGWRNYVTQTRTGISSTGFTWTVTAKKAGSTIVSQTVQYDAKSPSGKCTKNVKSMYRFNIKITN